MKRILCIVPILLLMAGMAAAQDVRFNYDKTADFTKYKTYKWVEIGTSDKDPLVDPQIRAAIEAEIVKKGLTKTESDTANLYVGYQAAITTEKQINSYSTDYGYGPGWGGRYYRGGYGGSTMSSSTTSTLYIGTLQIDLYDPSVKKTVFRTIGTKTIDTKAKPDKQREETGQGRSQDAEGLPAQSEVRRARISHGLSTAADQFDGMRSVSLATFQESVAETMHFRGEG